jgi:hypothetical protein
MGGGDAHWGPGPIALLTSFLLFPIKGGSKDSRLLRTDTVLSGCYQRFGRTCCRRPQDRILAGFIRDAFSTWATVG